MQKQKWQCRVAPSLGALEGTHNEVWGTDEYMNDRSPTVFFGLYGLPDFYALWRHRGRPAILWAGSDITHFQNGYHLDAKGDIRLSSESLAQWINKYCDSWVENKVEFNALLDMGIESKVAPSFMGNIDDYEISYVHRERPEVYLSANKGREVEYGWGIIEEIADKCNVDFHLYGSEDWASIHSNVFVHGRVSKEQMNEEIKRMQCGLRLNEYMDGFSEITAKSILWGQYPIVWRGYGYAGIDSFRNQEELIIKLNQLIKRTESNEEREYYKKVLNKYPWNTK